MADDEDTDSYENGKAIARTRKRKIMARTKRTPVKLDMTTAILKPYDRESKRAKRKRLAKKLRKRLKKINKTLAKSGKSRENFDLICFS